MIRLSKLADYAFVLLIQIVSENKAAWSAADLAEQTSLPLPTVAKVMKLLAKANLVAAQRGATGGYRLIKTPTEITVASIIEAVDGPISLTCCVNKREPHCAVKSFCSMRGCWDKLNQATRRSLEAVTLAELALNDPAKAVLAANESEEAAEKISEIA